MLPCATWQCLRQTVDEAARASITPATLGTETCGFVSGRIVNVNTIGLGYCRTVAELQRLSISVSIWVVMQFFVFGPVPLRLLQ